MINGGAAVRDFQLTPREIEVIRLVALGLNMKELGAHLKISPRTVEKHIEHAQKKLQARNKAHLVALALSSRMIAPIALVLEADEQDPDRR